jgi:hypothetical protein
MKKLIYLLIAGIFVVGLASCNQQNHGHKTPKNHGGKKHGGKNNCNCPTWD